MSTFARIDELRKKFEENPRRYFAPLANEYRKAGVLEQAIAICREHLPKQPGHMSGYIVFGQALYEAGELAEARTVFEQALALDPENLIALRHLGDIARTCGDASVARRWYERVLDADPRNDDIAAQLASLVTGLTPASVPAVPSSVHPFARPVESPPVATEAVGFAAQPTPDSVMRAVDLDAFAAKVVHRTPLDLDAMQEKEPAPTAAFVSTPAFVPAPPADHVTELVDLDEDESADFVAPVGLPSGDASSAHGTADTASLAAFSVDAFAEPSPRTEADAFDYPIEHEPDASLTPPAPVDVTMEALPTIAAAHAEMVVEMTEQAGRDVVELPAPAVQADAEAFEEGLVAPEWPDTSELLARVLSPRAFTPRAQTPVSSAVTEDALAAFGREAHEREVVESVEVNDDVMAEVVAAPTVEAAAAFESDAVAVPTVIEADVTTVVDTVVNSSPDAAEDTVVDVPSEEPTAEELPWLSVADQSADVAEGAESNEPGLEELAATMAGDALAAGDSSAVTFETIDELLIEPASAVEAQTFADLVLAVDAESAAEVELFGYSETSVEVPIGEPLVETTVSPIAEQYAVASDSPDEFDDEGLADDFFEVDDAAPPASDSPAFVTETMAELLVSQGFVRRAVEVYDELVRRRPYDSVLSHRRDELRAQLEPIATGAEAVEATSAADEADHLADTFAEPETGFQTPAVAWHAVMPAAPTPAYGTPAYGTPSYGTPAFGTPALGAPTFGTPGFGTPSVGSASVPTPTYVTQSFVTPLVSARVTPYAQPALDEVAPRRSAREWFAEIAARRVPRRTPPLSTPIVSDSPEGLASLFGADSPTHEDLAARALADAFAPVSSHELESGSALDFEFARSTPAFSPAVTPILSPAANMTPVGVTPVVPPRSVSATPAGTFAPVSSSTVPGGGGGNAGFSFDKFFPDPASQRQTPVNPVTSDAPVTDDLAQFSAWLKGLGNT